MSKGRREPRSASPESPRPNLPTHPASGTLSFEGLAAGFHEAQASSTTSMHSSPPMHPESAAFTRGLAAPDIEGSQETFSFEGSTAGAHEEQAHLATPMHPSPTVFVEFAPWARELAARNFEESSSSSEESTTESQIAWAGMPVQMHSSPSIHPESAAFARGLAAQNLEGSQSSSSSEESATDSHEALAGTPAQMHPSPTVFLDFAAWARELAAQNLEESSSSEESATDSQIAWAGMPAQMPSSFTMDPESAAQTSDISEQDVDSSQKSKKGKQPMRGPSGANESDSENWDRDFSDQRSTKSKLDMEGNMWDDTEDEMPTSSLSRYQDRLSRRMAQSLTRQWPSFPESTYAERFNPTPEAIAGPSGGAVGARGQPWSTVLMEEFQLPLRKRTAFGFGEAGPSNAGRTDSTDSSDIPDIRPVTAATAAAAAEERACVACGDSANETELIDVPCEHQYCQPCLLRHVEVALSDDTYFPPQCCGAKLPPSLLETHIGADLTKRYEEKVIERTDAARTYCSNKTCSSYILPSNVSGTVGSCSICDTKTCTVCKQAAHEGAECQAEKEEKDFLATATRFGWKRCECGHLIERSFGCIHVTCRCGRELCYECGQKWGTCDCGRTGMAEEQMTWWDEAREEPFLFPFRPPQPQEYRWLDRETRGVGCVHPQRWDRVDWGLLQCDLCFHSMPQFILQCPLCTLRACERCKRDLFRSFDL